MTAERNLLDYSIQKLEQLSSRIATCLDTLSDDQIWFRSSGNSNAPGNLVLHLSGNVRQWIVSGLGGKPDIRVRDREFSTRGGVTRQELKERLAGVVAEAVEVIRQLPEARMTEKVVIQGHEVTVLEAVYHVVEHFSGHTGQIIFASKALTEKDFGFYSYLNQPDSEKVP